MKNLKKPLFTGVISLFFLSAPMYLFGQYKYSAPKVQSAPKANVVPKVQTAPKPQTTFSTNSNVGEYYGDPSQIKVPQKYNPYTAPNSVANPETWQKFKHQQSLPTQTGVGHSPGSTGAPTHVPSTASPAPMIAPVMPFVAIPSPGSAAPSAPGIVTSIPSTAPSAPGELSTTPTWNTSSPAQTSLAPSGISTTPTWNTKPSESSTGAIQSAVPDKTLSVPTWNTPAPSPSVAASDSSSPTFSKPASPSVSAPSVINQKTATTSMDAPRLETMPVWRTPSQTASLPESLPADGIAGFERKGDPADRGFRPQKQELTNEELEALLKRPYREYERDSGPKRVKEVKKPEEGLKKEKLEKMNCSLLAAMLSGLKGKDASLCQNVMNAKCRSSTSVKLSGGMPDSAPVQTPVKQTFEEPKGVLAKVALAAVNSMEHDAEMERLYKALGMEPPGGSWEQKLLEDISKGLDAKTKADMAYIKDIEKTAGMLDEYKSPEKSDPSKLSIDLGYTKPKTSSARSTDYAKAAGAYIPPPMDLDEPFSQITQDRQISNLYDKNLSPAPASALTEAVFAAQNEGKIKVAKKWDGKSPPQHGWTDDKGQVWSENYGQWVNKDIFDGDEAQKSKEATNKLKNDKEREKAWDKYYDKDKGPAYGSDRYTAALLMEYKISEKLDKYPGLDPELKAKIGIQMKEAIITGAGPDEVKNIAQGHLKEYVNKQEEIAKKAGEEADWADTKLTLAKTGMSVATGSYGVAGLAAEIGLYTYAGMLEGDAMKGFKEGVMMNVPGTQTYQWAKDYAQGKASSWGIFGASLFDSMAAMGMFASYNSLKAGNIFGSPLASVGKTSALDDAINAWNMSSKTEKASLVAAANGQNKVKEFAGIFGEAAGDALKKGKAVEITPEIKMAALKIQTDLNAIKSLNKMDPQTIENYNSVIKSVYKSVDDKAIAAIKAKDSTIVSIEAFKVTNPSSKIKAGADQDITYRATYKDGTVKDISPEKLQKEINQAFYEEFGKPTLKEIDPYGIGNAILTKTGPGGVKIPPEPQEVLAFMAGQTATSRFSADAYGKNQYHLESVLYFKDEMFLGNTEYFRTFSHKNNEWLANSSKLKEAADTAEAAGDSAKALALRSYQTTYEAEGYRQFTKQWNGHVLPAIKNVEAACSELKITPPKSVPDEINVAVKMIESIGQVDPKSGHVITRDLVDFQIKQLKVNGSQAFGGIDDVTAKVSGYLEGYEHFVKNNKPLASKLAENGTDARKAWNADEQKVKTLGKVMETRL